MNNSDGAASKGGDAVLPTSISSGVRPMETLSDRLFRLVCTSFAVLTLVLIAYILFQIGFKALPAVREFGWGFLTSTKWDANTGEFGVLPEIWGTFYSASIALLIGGSFGIAIAIFLTEDFLPPRIEWVFKNIIELLAAIPSVVYGLWGIFVVIPMLRPLAGWLHEYFGWIPIFGTSLSGPGMLPASLVLAIMILPTVSALSRDALKAVPQRLKDAALGLGATRWETILKVILPTAARGLFGAIVLGFGRALGETMALAMLVGNSNQLSISLFSPANTLAALLANNFPEAGAQEEPVLLYAALVLMAMTLGVNILGAIILERSTTRLSGGK